MATLSDDNAVIGQSDKSICQLIYIRCNCYLTLVPESQNIVIFEKIHIRKVSAGKKQIDNIIM